MASRIVSYRLSDRRLCWCVIQRASAATWRSPLSSTRPPRQTTTSGRYIISSHVLYSITPSLFHSRLKTFLFSKSFPPQPSFSSSGLTQRIPRTVYRYCDLSIFVFLLFFFFVFPRFSCWFRAVD